MSSDRPPADKINVYRGPYHWFLPSYYDYLHRAQISVLDQVTWRQQRVLDVGCGDGRIAHLLALEGARVTGLEHQFAPLRLARLMTQMNGTAPGFVQGDAAALPFGASAFTGIVALDVIEHLPEGLAQRLLIECRRVLEAGGWILLSSPNRRSLRSRLLGHRLDPKHYFEFDAEQFRAAVEHAGFSDVRVHGLGLTPPIPRVEHFASVVPFRALFRRLAMAGRRVPSWADRLLVVGRRR